MEQLAYSRLRCKALLAATQTSEEGPLGASAPEGRYPAACITEHSSRNSSKPGGGHDACMQLMEHH